MLHFPIRHLMDVFHNISHDLKLNSRNFLMGTADALTKMYSQKNCASFNTKYTFSTTTSRLMPFLGEFVHTNRRLELKHYEWAQVTESSEFDENAQDPP